MDSKDLILDGHRYLSPKTVCEKCDLPRSTFDYFLKSGQLRYYQLGPRVKRVREDHLKEWLESCYREGGNSEEAD